MSGFRHLAILASLCYCFILVGSTDAAPVERNWPLTTTVATSFVQDGEQTKAPTKEDSSPDTKKSADDAETAEDEEHGGWKRNLFLRPGPVPGRHQRILRRRRVCVRESSRQSDSTVCSRRSTVCENRKVAGRAFGRFAFGVPTGNHDRLVGSGSRRGTSVPRTYLSRTFTVH